MQVYPIREDKRALISAVTGLPTIRCGLKYLTDQRGSNPQERFCKRRVARTKFDAERRSF